MMKMWIIKITMITTMEITTNKFKQWPIFPQLLKALKLRLLQCSIGHGESSLWTEPKISCALVWIFLLAATCIDPSWIRNVSRTNTVDNLWNSCVFSEICSSKSEIKKNNANGKEIIWRKKTFHGREQDINGFLGVGQPKSLNYINPRALQAAFQEKAKHADV